MTAVARCEGCGERARRWFPGGLQPGEAVLYCEECGTERGMVELEMGADAVEGFLAEERRVAPQWMVYRGWFTGQPLVGAEWAAFVDGYDGWCTEPEGARRFATASAAATHAREQLGWALGTFGVVQAWEVRP